MFPAGQPAGRWTRAAADRVNRFTSAKCAASRLRARTRGRTDFPVADANTCGRSRPEPPAAKDGARHRGNRKSAHSADPFVTADPVERQLAGKGLKQDRTEPKDVGGRTDFLVFPQPLLGRHISRVAPVRRMPGRGDLAA